MLRRLSLLIFIFSVALSRSMSAQNPKLDDVVTPLHALTPEYPVPYTVPKIDEVKGLLIRIHNYLDSVTPYQFVDRRTTAIIKAVSYTHLRAHETPEHLVCR